jgi:DHA1 family bicyclomycin/chloramphenicol resistance-like MFS transporter
MPVMRTEREPLAHGRRAAPPGIALVLGLLAAFGPLSIDMYLPVLPEIGEELGGDAKVTLAIFFAGMAAGQLAYGPLADRYGRRRPLFVAIALYSLASAGCALAATLPGLGWFRLLQALGACAGMVIARAVVRDLADRVDPARLMARLMIVMGLAPILAPMFGGWIAAWLGWRAIFWVLTLIGLFAFAVVLAFLPDTLPPERRRQVSPIAILGDYLSLLRHPRFMAAALPGAAAIAGLFAYIAGSPAVFIGIFGVKAEHYGLYFGAGAAGIIGLSTLSARLAPRFGQQRLYAAALAALALTSLAVLALAWAEVGFATLYAGLFLYLAALGAVLPLSSVLAVQPFPRMAGTASALFGTMQFSLGALAGAALAALPDGTAWPMASVMMACAMLAATSHGLLARRAATHRDMGE